MNTTSPDSRDSFVAGLRTDILRFETGHPGRELRAALAEKEAEIERLKARLAALQQERRVQERCASSPSVTEEAEAIYRHQLAQAQQFANENSKADISRLHDLLRRIMPAEFHGEIDNIREGKAFVRIEISGGNNQILPGADAGVQNNSCFCNRI